MANLTLEQNSLHGGEISPLLYGRRDLPLYANALARCRNALPLPTGGVTNRPGTRLRFATVAYGAQTCPVLALHEHTITLSGRSTRYLMAICEYDAGDTLTKLYMVAIHSLAGILLDIVTLDATLFNLTTDYNPTLISDGLHVASIDNAFYLTHVQMPPQRLYRNNSDTDWRGGELVLTFPPSYRPPATETMTLTPDADVTIEASATTGTITLTASKAIFGQAVLNCPITLHDGEATITAVAGSTCTATVTTPLSATTATTVFVLNNWDRSDFVVLTATGDLFSSGHIGSCVYLHDGRIYLWDVISATRAIGTLLAPLTATTATTAWTLDAWSTAHGWPRLVCAADQRLLFGSSNAQPSHIWGSRINSYGDFLANDATADAPWAYALSGSSTVLRHLRVFDSLLVLSGDAMMAVSGSGSKMPTAIDVRSGVRVNDGGSLTAAPVLFGSDLIFVPDDGLRLLQVEYSNEVDKFLTVDLAQHASHLITSPIVSLAVTRLPQPVIWLALQEGTLLSCTYDPANQVIAWARHERASVSDDPQQIRTILAVPQEDAIDRLYLYSGFGVEEIDYSLRLDAVPTMTVSGTVASGLTPLIGAAVMVIIAGVPQGLQTVSATGTITVPDGTLAADLQAGLPISVQVKPLPPPLSAATGHATRAVREWLLLHETQTLTVDGNPLPFYADDGGALPLTSGWVETTSLRGWSNTNDTLAPDLTLTTPHTVTLLALARPVTVNS